MGWAQAFLNNIVYYNLLTGLKLVMLPTAFLSNIKKIMFLYARNRLDILKHFMTVNFISFL